MLNPSLSTLAVVLGLLVALPNIYGLVKPAHFGTVARKFPRSTIWGYLLMLLGTVWFIYNVKQENVADFEPIKVYLYALFIAVGIGSCLFVRDFLAVRGLAVVILLLAKLMVDTARWAETDWRLVIVTWAYLLVIAGMWFTISPWRMRDLVNWGTASEKRIRIGSAVRVAFGLLVVVLGFTAFRGA
jgi:hypothetical protein